MWLGDSWVKATPAFNIELCERFGVKPLDFDGYHDAMLHPYSVDGRLHMEYVAQRGVYADLPLEEIVETFAKVYGTDSLLPPEEPVGDLFTAGS